MALAVYDALIEAGRHHGLRHCGYHALNSLRIEKAYREWAHDMEPCDTLIEAGFGFTCAWDKPGGFVGREALLPLREAGPPERCLVQLLLTDAEPVLAHNEPILCDGVPVGYTTSSAYAHTLDACAAMGYVSARGGVSSQWLDAGAFSIEQANRRYTVLVSLKPMYDPTGLRMRR